MIIITTILPSRHLPELELKPTEVRKSEKVPLIVAIWWLFACAFLSGLTFVVSDYNWKLAVGFSFPALFFGYLVGTRFRIILKR